MKANKSRYSAHYSSGSWLFVSSAELQSFIWRAVFESVHLTSS